MHIANSRDPSLWSMWYPELLEYIILHNMHTTDLYIIRDTLVQAR